MVLAQAITASLITSVVPALILLVLPKAGVRPWVLRTMLAFAAGGLLGDVFLHMLPAMMGGHDHHDHVHDHHHDHDHDHDHSHGDHGHSHGDQTPMLLVLVGIISFFAIDGVMKALRGGGGGHSHGHSHGSPTAKKDKKNRDTPKGPHQGSETKAWLNLVADTAHNFTDGFVIGVAFLTQPATAHRTTLLILVHEVPHELGDFAVLASCGWNLRDIFSFQLVTALGNLSGCILVVLLGTAVEGSKYYIGPFAAGSFIYMALCSILSELNQDEEGDQVVSTTMAVDDNKKLQKGSTSNLLGERLLHTVALSLGILSMYLVVWMEEYLGVHAH